MRRPQPLVRFNRVPIRQISAQADIRTNLGLAAFAHSLSPKFNARLVFKPRPNANREHQKEGQQKFFLKTSCQARSV
jgi:hypothetical protein